MEKIRKNFNSQVKDILNTKYLNTKLIYAFSLVNDETTNTPETINAGKMVGKLYIQLNNSAEYTIINFQIVSCEL